MFHKVQSSFSRVDFMLSCLKKADSKHWSQQTDANVLLNLFTICNLSYIDAAHNCIISSECNVIEC